LSALSFAAHADEIDFGISRLQWYSYGELDADSGGTSLQMQQARIQSPLTKPIEMANALYMVPGFRYEFTGFEGPDPTLNVLREDLHMVELPLLFVYRPSDSAWSYNTRVSPGLSSDFGSITTDDIFCDLRLGGNYQFSDKLDINFGIAYTRAIGEPQFFPYLGFIYNMNDQWQFSLRGFTFEARCHLSESWIVRAIGEASGGYWNIDTPDSQNLAIRNYRIGLTIEHELSEDLWLVAGAGYTLGNEVRWHNQSNDTIQRQDFENGTYFTLGLRLRDW
jgi:hypothetical protein